MPDVRKWLESLGLGRYADAFEHGAIGWDVLGELDHEVLKDIGITAAGDRLRILKAARSLPGDESPPRETGADSPHTPVAPYTGTAERRQLSVMFCDLADSTALSQRLDPEDFREVIRSHQAACSRAIEAHGGFIARFLGDGILAYFGYPQADEDDAERAVRAGLAVLEATEALRRAPQAPPGPELQIRVGIETGPVVVGDIVGDGAAQERTALGETPNVAARLQSVARPGQAVIGPGTQALVAGLFRLEELGAQALKGIASPVPAFRVLGESGAASRFEATAARGLSPMVGRDAEIAVIERRWRQASEGQGQVVVLTGPAGIGKSRLVRGFQESLSSPPRSRILYHCSAHHRESAFYPAIEQLRRVLRLTPGEGPEAELDRLEATLGSLGLEVGRAAPALAELLSLPGARYPPGEPDPQQRRERVLHTFLSIYERMAARTPVLLVVEDVHWADPSTRELLDRAVGQLQQSRILALFTARPQFEARWGQHTHVTALSLNHLTREEGRAIARTIAKERALPDGTVDAILERAEGVPLFIEELTKAVLEAAPAGGPGPAASGPGAPASIPASLHDSLVARLDRLGPAKELAQLSSALGRSFSHELLAAVWPHDRERLHSCLEALVEADLIQRRGLPPHASYMFKHALLQDIAYQVLLKSTRRQYHACIASTLVERFEAIATAEPEVVAHHFTEAGLAEHAARYWALAGRRAWNQSAGREAVVHLQRGLEQLAALDRSQSIDRQELELRVMLGAALGATQGWATPAVERNYVRARELGKAVGDRAQRFAVTWGLWLFAQMAGQIPKARRLAESLLQLSRQAPDSEFPLQAHHAAWTTAMRVAEFDSCLHHAARGAEIYDPTRHRHHAFVYGGHDPGVCAQSNLAVSRWALGYPQQALASATEAARLAELLQQPMSHCSAYFFGAHIHQLRGEPQACLQRAGELVSLCRERGYPQFLAQGEIMRGWALTMTGDAAQGIRILRGGLDAYRDTGASARGSYFLSLLADGLLHGGRIQEAEEAARAALDLIATTGEVTYVADVHRILGNVLAAAGDRVAAEARLCEAVSLASAQGARAFELRAATSLARLRRDLGAAGQDAAAPLAAVHAQLSEGFDTADVRAAAALLEELA